MAEEEAVSDPWEASGQALLACALLSFAWPTLGALGREEQWTECE